MEIEIVRGQRKKRKFYPKEKRNKLILAILLLSESVINTFIPFMSGVYFAITQSLIWLILFLLLLVFNLRIVYTGRNVKVQIIRKL